MQGGLLAVKHLKVWRDVYYIASSYQTTRGLPTDYSGPRQSLLGMNYQELLDFWSTPAAWSPAGGGGPFAERQAVEFPARGRPVLHAGRQ